MFKSQQKVLLTGTPLQNNMRELWALLSFCSQDFGEDGEDFMAWLELAAPSPPSSDEEGGELSPDASHGASPPPATPPPPPIRKASKPVAAPGNTSGWPQSPPWRPPQWLVTFLNRFKRGPMGFLDKVKSGAKDAADSAAKGARRAKLEAEILYAEKKAKGAKEAFGVACFDAMAAGDDALMYIWDMLTGEVVFGKRFAKPCTLFELTAVSEKGRRRAYECVMATEGSADIDH